MDARKTWTVILGQNAMTVNAYAKEIQQGMESTVEVIHHGKTGF